jgi:hypothetical protein
MTKENTLYKHFKGGLYKTHSEVNICLPDAPDTIPGIIYQNLETGVLHCRTQLDFDYEGLLSDGTVGKRFDEVISTETEKCGNCSGWPPNSFDEEKEYECTKRNKRILYYGWCTEHTPPTTSPKCPLCELTSGDYNPETVKAIEETLQMVEAEKLVKDLQGNDQLEIYLTVNGERIKSFNSIQDVFKELEKRAEDGNE